MTPKEKEFWKKALEHKHEPDDEKGLNNVDGFLFKENGAWTMDIEYPMDGVVYRMGITHCPWCGEKLE